MSTCKCSNMEEVKILTTKESLDDWKPISFPSQIIQDLIEKLRNHHNDCVSAICTKLTLTNKEIESDIRIKSYELKSELNVYKRTGCSIINNLQSSQDEILNYDESEFLRVKSLCMNLIQQGKYKIDKYYEFLQNAEKSRTDKFKIHLQSGYKKIQKCSYKLPYEMQQFFEKQILHLNQMLLVNLRNYKELQLSLSLAFYNDIKLMLYEITKYESQWRELRRRELINRLKEYDIQEGEFAQLWCNNISIETIVAKVDERINKEIKQKQITLQLQEMHDQEWCKQIHDIINNINESTEALIDLYKLTMDVLSTNDDFDTVELQSKLLEIQIVEPSELENFNGIPVKPNQCSVDAIVLNGKSNHKETNENLWRIMLQNVLTYIQVHYAYLHDVFDSGDKHLKRVQTNKSQILSNLAQITEKNDTTLQNKHGKVLNKAINTLRQQMDEKVLQKSLRKVYDELNKIKRILNSNKETETKTINKYHEYVKRENEILRRELKECLNNHELNHIFIYTLPDDLSTNKTLVLFEQLQLCEEPITELKECKTRLNGSLYRYIESSLIRQCDQATLWTTAETEKLFKNFENKMVAHELRYDDIRVEVHDVRLRDIRKHSTQFAIHKTNVEGRLLQLNKNTGTFEENLRPEIDKMTRALKDVCDDSKKSRYPAHASTYLINASRIVDNKLQFIKEQVHIYQDQMNLAIDDIIKDNDNYRLQIRTFSEDGSYSTKEASEFIKKLQYVQLYCKKQSAGLQREIHEVEKNLLKQVHHHITWPHMKRLENIMTTVKCYETSVGQLMTVQNELKREAAVMKYMRRRIDAINEKIKAHARAVQDGDWNDLSSVEFVIKYFKELIVYCNEYHEYLEQTDAQYSIVPFAVEENLTDRSKLKESHTLKNKHKNVLVVQFTDYTNQLFACFTRSSTNKFIPRISNILQNALINIQTSAKEFYTKELVQDLENISVPVNYDTYMTEVIAKFKYYFIQCAYLWLQHVDYFINIINDMRIFMNEYSNNCLRSVHGNQMHKITTEYCGYLGNVRQTSVCKIHKMHMQLKPLHGYHGNKQLLDNLIKQMTEVLSNVKADIQCSLRTYKEDLLEYRKEYDNSMTYVKSLTDVLRTLLNEHTCSTTLLEQADLCRITLTSLNISESSCGAIVSTDSTNAINFVKIPETAPEIEPVDVECLALSFEGELNDQGIKIDEFQIKFHEELTALEAVWNYDLNTVFNLFSVKYV